MAKAEILKRDLKKVVKEIREGDDVKVEKIEEALQILGSLMELALSKLVSVSAKLGSLIVPEEFKCPISRELMRDPVVTASGETFDRPYIQRWLKEGHRSCPKTQQVLSNTFLTPNYLVREMISQWCKKRGLELPRPVTEEEAFTHAEREHLSQLLEKLSSSPSDQKEAAKTIRLLTKQKPLFRALITECADRISQLLSPLIPGVDDVDPDLQEDIITTIFNISIQDDNSKRVIADNPDAIPILVHSLESGTMATRTNAAAALSSLSALDCNKSLIGKANAIQPLIELVEFGDRLARKDAASALYNLCLIQENKTRAVQGGAVRVAVQMIIKFALVDEMVSILALLSGHHKAVKDIVKLKAVHYLLNITKDTTYERTIENCVAILCAICSHDSTGLMEIREEEEDYGTISKVAQSGTSRAQRKANEILKRLRKPGGASTSATHTFA